MRTVTETELAEWVLKQDPCRPVNMQQNISSQKCGCLMVQFGRDVLGFGEQFHCGVFTWARQGTTVAELDEFTYRKWGVRHLTFGSLQREIRRQRGEECPATV